MQKLHIMYKEMSIYCVCVWGGGGGGGLNISVKHRKSPEV